MAIPMFFRWAVRHGMVKLMLRRPAQAREPQALLMLDRTSSTPGQLGAVRAEPALWPNAVEEILRFESPVQGTTVRVDVVQQACGSSEHPGPRRDRYAQGDPAGDPESGVGLGLLVRRRHQDGLAARCPPGQYRRPESTMLIGNSLRACAWWSARTLQACG